jgi:hypothetical protein
MTICLIKIKHNIKSTFFISFVQKINKFEKIIISIPFIFC